MRTIYPFLLFICLFMGGLMPVSAQVETDDPVILVAPDTVIDKTAYTLSGQGVTIAVSKGSAYPAGHSYNNIQRTYFACLAGEHMTISAERDILGVAVNGWVRKSFDASSDYGTISFLSDDYDDAVGEPVLTVTDINKPSVTITCNNQLRCFSVEIYFSENPGMIHSEETDTVRLTIASAQALDYSEDSRYSAEGAYSYWLELVPAEGYPQVWLDLYAAAKGDLSGEYSLYNYNVGDYTYVQLSADELDYEYAYDQDFVISRNGGNYHIEGFIIAQNDVQYEFVYDGPVALVQVEEEGIDPVQGDDVRCSKVLRTGQLLIEQNGHIYNAQGIQLK